MSDSISKPPAWVAKRDGRLVPFESDKISRALFAAAEEIGQADAFLARELADSVVFFLAGENPDTTPTTVQIAELVVKVVRELGQPALAAAFAAGAGRKPQGPRPERRDSAPADELVYRFSPATPLPEVLAGCARQYGLAAVYSRDLAAVHADGLLTIQGLESPETLAACCCVPPPGQSLIAALEEARQKAADTVALDGLEDALSSPGAADRLAREVTLGLRAVGLRGVVNLHCAAPPSAAHDLVAGPLFSGQPDAAPADRAARADALREALAPERGLRIDWHLGQRDFQPDQRPRLLAVIKQALGGAHLTFVFDRPRHPVALAEGLDRQNAAVLLTVSLQLPRLLEATRGGDADLFVHKLGSLARLALSAAVQKRDFLRRTRPDLGRGFLLERARLLVVPGGLDDVVRRVRGTSLTSGGAGLDFARRVVKRLADVLGQDGEACRLRTCLDLSVAGEAAAGLKNPLRAVSSLSPEGVSAVLSGTADVDSAADGLRWAWQRTDLARVRFESRLRLSDPL